MDDEHSIISGAWSFPVQPGFPRSVGAWGRRLAVQGRRGCRRRRRRWRCWCRRQQDGLRPRQRPVRLTVWDGPTGQGGRSPHPGFLSTFLGRTLACPNETYTSRPPPPRFLLRAEHFSSFYLVSIFFSFFSFPLIWRDNFIWSLEIDFFSIFEHFLPIKVISVD